VSETPVKDLIELTSNKKEKVFSVPEYTRFGLFCSGHCETRQSPQQQQKVMSSSFPRRALPSPEHQNLRPNHHHHHHHHAPNNNNNNTNNLLMMKQQQERLPKTTRPQWTVTMNPSQCLFRSVAERNYSTLLQLFAHNARNSVVSYLAMKRHRWGGGRTMHRNSGTVVVGQDDNDDDDYVSHSRASLGGGSFAGGSVQAGT
jgi:hypothetical protein